MLAQFLHAPRRGPIWAVVVSALLPALVHAQISGSNPTVGTTTKTLSPTDVFTGTLSVGTNGSSGGTLNLITGNFTATAGQSFSFSGNGSYLSYAGLGSPPTLLLPSGASLTRSGATAGYTYVYDNISNSGNVTISGGTLQFQSGTTLTNNSGGNVAVSGPGSVLYLQGLANSGTLGADTNGLVQLAGNFTTAGLGSFTTASGGAVKLSGNLDNSSATLSLPSGSAVTLFGGTISGGTISSASFAPSTSGGTLDGAIINGGLSLSGSQVVSLKNGAGATGTTLVDTSTLYLSSNLTAQANSALVFTGNGSYLSYNVGGSPLTLTLPSTVSLTRSNVGANGYTYVYDNISNSGNVTISGGTLQFQSNTTLTNNSGGNVTVSGTGSNLYLYGLANSGNLTVDTNGLVQLAGNFTTSGLGSFTTASGGAVKLSGNLDNSSATLSLPTNTALTLFGGTITGGNITSASFAPSTSGGTLDGALINGALSLASSQYVTLKNGAGATGTTTVNTGTLYLATDLTAQANSSYVFTGNGSYLSYTGGPIRSFTLPATVSLTRNNSGGSGYTYVYDNLINSGNVTISGGTLQFQSGTTLTNNSGGNVTVSGTGSNLYLYGLANSGNLSVDTSGLVQLAGNFTSSGLGNITIASGGAVQLSGNLTSTSLAAPTGGSYALMGGTVTGGTIASGALAFTTSGGYLDNASLLGDLTLPSSAYVRLTNGANFTGGNLTLSSNASLYWQQIGTLASKAITIGSGGYIYVAGANHTLTLDSYTTGSGQIQIYSDGSAGTAITNQAVLTHSTGYGQIYASNLTNSGNIVSTASNASLQLGSTSTGYNTANAGSITVNGTNATIYLDGNFSNTGSLVATAGQFQFRGNNTSSNLNGGTLNIASGAHAYLGGTITNTALNAPAAGSYELYGGTVTGGTIAAGALGFTSSGGYLDNTSLLDNLTLGTSAFVRFTNSANFTGATATLAANSAVYWQQVGTLANKTITLGGGAYLYVAGANNSLTLAPSTAVSGSANVYTDGSTGGVITNQGTITQTSASSYGQIYAPTFTNSGSISATAGTLYVGNPSAGYNSTNATGGTITVTGSGTTVYLRGNFTNSGTLFAQSSGQLIFDGTNSTGNLGNVTLSTGGRALLNGTLTNANLTAPTGGKFELYGGTITGGTIAAGALGFTSSGGYLDNTSLLDNLTLGTSAFVRFVNGASFTGAIATLAANSGVYWQQIGTLTGKNLTLGSSAYLYVAGANNTLTLSPTTTLTGDANLYTDGSSGTAITNQGTITHNSGTGSLYAPNFTNSGSITSTSGTLYLGYPSTGYTFTNSSGGTITANGGTVWIQNSATTPFANLGTLTAQSGSLVSSTAIANSGNINIVNGASFNSSSATSFSQSAGTLKIDGSFSTPNSGASIAGGSVTGSGTITGNVTFGGGTLDPGSSIGTLTFVGNLTLTGGATTNLELGAGTNDHVIVSGGSNSLVFGGTLNILAVSTAFASGQTWNLFTFGTHSGSFASISLPYTGNGWVWDTSQLTNTGVLTLTTFVPISVPEPSTYALLTTGLGLLFAAHRRAVRLKRRPR